MSKPPFQQSVTEMVGAFKISTDQAIQRVQSYYSGFVQRNDQLIGHQNDAANTASSHLNNQLTLVATATLTFTGAFVGVVYKTMTNTQIVLFIVIAAIELAALTLTLIDYLWTIRFHNNWAKTYFNIAKEVEKKVDNGTLQETSQLGKIEAEHIARMQVETGLRLPTIAIACTMLGAWLFFCLALVYFFDVPFYQ